MFFSYYGLIIFSSLKRFVFTPVSTNCFHCKYTKERKSGELKEGRRRACAPPSSYHCIESRMISLFHHKLSFAEFVHAQHSSLNHKLFPVLYVHTLGLAIESVLTKILITHILFLCLLYYI